jgi:hypothetical protein
LCCCHCSCCWWGESRAKGIGAAVRAMCSHSRMPS